MPQVGVRGDRETALERQRVLGVLRPAEKHGLLEAGVHSSISSRGVACGALHGVPCLGGGGCWGSRQTNPSDWVRGGSSPPLQSRQGTTVGVRPYQMQIRIRPPGMGAAPCREEVTKPCSKGERQRPISARVSACVLPVMPTCEAHAST